MKCRFCNNKEASKEILDGETLLTIQVCESCSEETHKIDCLVDNQIEDMRLEKLGII